MTSVISSIAGGLVAVCKPLCGSIYPKMKSVFRFRSNLETLKKEFGNLIEDGNRVKEQIEAAGRRGQVAAPGVTKWLEDLEAVEKEVNSIEASVEGNGENKGELRPTPSFCLRYTLGVKVDKNLTEVRRLIKAVEFRSSMVVENYQVKQVVYIPGPSIAGQLTASKNLRKVMNLLNDDNVSRIGVWGMGGVGKTTLVKNLNNELKTAAASFAQPFSIIIWVTASKEFDITRLQTQLLRRLNLVVEEGESKDSIAGRLHDQLNMERRFLLILDDVWEKIKLDDLGVPQAQREFRKGNKVIITSRSLDVCRQMKTDIDVKVDVLNEEESWQLFTENAGQVASLPLIKPIAIEVTKECSGLPLAIIIVGASMRGKRTDKLWNDALNALQRSVPRIKGIKDEVYKPLKCSYDSLFFQGMNIKSCFLYCSLYPEDFSIEVRELVQCWIAEGLVDEQENYEVSVNRGIALVENLKDSCLLEDGTFKDTVKMHDVVRDVAIWIASSEELDGCKSFVRSGIGLNQISEFELSKSLKRVSFVDNKITRLPDLAIQCPKVSSLLLQGNLRLQIVPEKFLLGFPALEVLNLSETGIQTLPHSLNQLHKLKALLLRRCQKLKDLPPLGRLGTLQVLDCSFTNLEVLPKGMENLTYLRLLDLSETHHLRHIQNGIISKLSRLETIDMTNSFYKWGGKRSKEESGPTLIDELGCLDRLSALFINLESSYLAFEDLSWIERLKGFHFVVGRTNPTNPDEKLLIQQKYKDRSVTLCRVDLFGKYWVKELFENASNLTLENCLRLEQIPVGLAKNCHCFIGLKSLTIVDQDGEFPPARVDDPFDLLPNLEELTVFEAYQLESISQLARHLKLRFSKLRKISVSNCMTLKHLISSSGTLENLEEITLSYCWNFVELFENASSSQTFDNFVELVENANFAELVENANFAELFENASSSQTLFPSHSASQTLFPSLSELRFSKLRKISVSNCTTLKHLISSSGTLENLEEITVSYCKNFVELFENASSSQTLFPSCILPNLRIMKLRGLPKLTTLYGQHQSWQHLEELEVMDCNRIRKLPFTKQNANTIKKIRGESQWWNNLEWDDEDTKSSLQQYFNPC